LKFALAHDKDQSMKRNRFSEEQIIGISKEHEAGVSVADLCRKHGVSASMDATWHFGEIRNRQARINTYSLTMRRTPP
jgi:putative transposase